MNLETVSGIGEKTKTILNKLGIYNTEDLVNYYPFRYEVICRSNIDKLNQDDKIIIDGTIEIVPRVIRFKKNMDKMSFTLNTGKKIINVTIFNRGFLKSRLVIGSKITVIGKYDKKHNLVVASDIRFGLLGNNAQIEPIYHLSNGINNNQINNLINKCIDRYEVVDYIPDYLTEKYNFLSKKQSLKEIHNPLQENTLKQSLMRYKYEELFTFMLKINMLKKTKKQQGLKRTIEYEKVTKLINNLPFELTIDQIKAVDDIYNDLTSESRMNRLLQGDVGSGKTIVSFIALYINYLAGYQGALMAPTEILAGQHYINIKKILPDLKIGLLTGKLKVKKKEKYIINYQTMNLIS